MSTNDTEESSDEVCASCGTTAVDDVTLKKCACNLVKYCGIKCQKEHRSKHKKVCKKRLAEMHDDDVFTQPDGSHMGECPICFLPLPLHPRKSTMMGCCSKLICRGCDHANATSQVEQGQEQRCAFCREPAPESEDEHYKNVMNRIEKHDDPVAMTQMGKKNYHEGDYGKALQYYTKAAELGDVEAHYLLGGLYCHGEGVEKDEKKAVSHWEQAAIGGHPGARGMLAMHETENGRFDRAAKHFIIAANLGCDDSLKAVKELFGQGIVSKDEYAAALRRYQAAVDATNSAEREEGEMFC